MDLFGNPSLGYSISRRGGSGRPPSSDSLAGIHRCWACKERKPVSEFYKDRNKPSGYGFLCKPCNKIRKKTYHAEYQVRCREGIAQRARARYLANRDARLKKDKERRLINGHRWNATERAKHAANPIPNMLANAKTRAQKKNLPFDLCLEDISVPNVCPALGIPLVVTPGKTTGNSPSLDRIHNAKGYVRGNVVVVSFKANTIKNNATVEDLRMVLAFYEKFA